VVDEEIFEIFEPPAKRVVPAPESVSTLGTEMGYSNLVPNHWRLT
jgi:hypothetical protein